MKKIVKGKISVLTLTYNHEAYIIECLKSIESQISSKDLHIQVVLSDDASTDGTLRKALDYKTNTRLDIKIITRERNVGVSNNFLEAIEQCDGEFIVFLDGDDALLPGKIDKSLQVFRNNENVNLVHHNVNEIDRFSKMIRPEKFTNGIEGTIDNYFSECLEYIQSCALMVRNNVFIKWSEVIISENNLVDLPFIITLVDNGDVFYIDEVLSSYRILNSSIMRTTNLIAHEKNTRQYIKKLAGNKNSPMRTALSGSYIRQAICFYQDRKFAQSLKSVLKSLSLYPSYNSTLLRYYYRLFRLILRCGNNDS